MDSKAVNKAIKAKIWPVLKQAGFSAFTSRVAWRFCADRIEVIEFQSFNSYNASIIGVTTFSFSVNIGMFPLYVPPQWPPKVKDGKLLPSQAECPFRGSLERSIQSEIKTTAIWPVNADGNNLGWCIQDVLSQLPNAFNWFANLSSKERVLQVLTSEIEDMVKLWGFGRNPSPIRSYLSGYVALALGEQKLAEEKLTEAVTSNCFINLFNSTEGAIQRAL
jgi:hypothetical protein